MEYNLILYEEPIKVKLVHTKYYKTGELAVLLLTSLDSEPEEYAMITVCIPHGTYELQPDMGFVDINNCPWAPEFLETNKIATRIVGCNATSGFVSYPLYEFDMSKIEEY